MVFVNLSLLLGTMLVGIPVVLHLVMRQKPKQLIFPAIRFIQKRHESNRRTLRLRHWLLLLLRCLVIIFAALALARPSVSSGLFGNWIIITALGVLLLLTGVMFAAGLFTHRGTTVLVVLGSIALTTLAGLLVMLIETLRQTDASLIGDREAPVAAVMVFDSSPRMQYRYDNRTRLELAKEDADWLVRQLPPDSKVGVLDSRAIAPIFSVDLAAARKTIERVNITGAPRPLERLLQTALQLVGESPLKRKEIYVFTDLAAAAWQGGDEDRLRRRLEDAKEVGLYIIDVGVEKPQNFFLGGLELSAETLPENSTLTVRTTLSCLGSGGRRSVELYVEDLDPTLPVVRDGNLVVPTSRLRSRQEVALDENGSATVEFTIAGLSLGTRHAELRIGGQDALPVDDSRFLTVVVRPPWPVLIVAPPDVNTSGFVEVIAPYKFRLEDRAAYDCKVTTPEEITDRLEQYAAVVLLDPTPLTPNAWQALGDYVREGGQLAIFLGHNARDASSFNASEALQLLPGKLGRQYRVTGRDVFLAPHSYDHPMLRPFRANPTSVPWDQFPVFRHWSLHDLAADTQVILRFGNSQPAILERRVGAGTVITMTTPITELERPRGRQAWNELAGLNDWPRFVLVNQLMRYLTQHDAGQYNYATGQDVVLANQSDNDPSRYLLFTPSGDTQPVQARDGKLTISTTDTPGIYRLKGERAVPVARGFSVNLPATASQLERVDRKRLDQLLGSERYQFARERDQITRVQGRQRSGREFFPFLMVLVAATLVLEQLLSNRFYRADSAQSP